MNIDFSMNFSKKLTEKGQDFFIYSLTLPYPCSVNHYWNIYNNRPVPSKKAKDYRKKVLEIVKWAGMKTIEKPVCLLVDLHYPDRRKRDIDNPLKCLLDALTAAHVWVDDSQIKRLCVTARIDPERQGKAIIFVLEEDYLRSFLEKGHDNV